MFLRYRFLAYFILQQYHLEANFLQKIPCVPQGLDLQIEDIVRRWRIWFSENFVQENSSDLQILEARLNK